MYNIIDIVIVCYLKIRMYPVHLAMVFDGMERDGSVHFSVLERLCIRICPAAVVVQDCLHLEQNIQFINLISTKAYFSI